jgi:AAA ATPase domain
VVPAPGHPTAHPVAPSTLTSFVGRDTEVAQVLKNLGSARLVTLAGPGGVGKTRLAAEVSGRLTGAAWFVELAPVTDPADMPRAVLDALGIRERVGPGRRPRDSVPLPRAAEHDLVPGRD